MLIVPPFADIFHGTPNSGGTFLSYICFIHFHFYWKLRGAKIQVSVLWGVKLIRKCYYYCRCRILSSYSIISVKKILALKSQCLT